ncbi:MAG: polyribonucleotide nucleotidyltransferase, partial [Chloroflexi bacterium]|nr:polyribonucleotide nucleotidyltransferase [Chloroflexota bacterium]
MTTQTTTGELRQAQTFSREIEGKTLEISTGLLAPNALAACTVRYGDTILLVTVCEGDPRPGIDFFPLTVDFEERMYAIGKVPGSFFRREGRPGTDATLAARMTDRPIRPLFPKGFTREVQVVCTLLSSDRENPGDALATIGASTVINLSPLPFEGPVSSVRVGRVDGKLKAFPTYEDAANSDLELTVAATNDSVVMLEAGARQVPEAELIAAIEYAENICRQLNDLQAEVVAALGQPKMTYAPPADASELQDRVRALLAGRDEEMLNAVKSEGFRGVDQMGAKVLRELTESLPADEAAKLEAGAVRAATESVLKAFVRGRVLSADMRADGRRPDQLRELTAQVGLLPRVHGSGLFQRGETQVLSVATLGPIGDRQKLDNINPEPWKRFMLHYNFLPFSVGEARFLRGPGRREIGHGMLGEKALEAVMPPFEEFPYTVRIVSDVLSSNGSTSQASICAGTLALMDAGVPIMAPVAGIAMGLVTNEDASDYRILTDIAGIEDGFGDMDFKVAGTERGVTAVQLDIKLKRLPSDFLTEVFRRAREARLEILRVMATAISAPRDEVAEHAPKIIVVKIDPEKIGAIIGPGGRVINAIIGRTGAAIDVEPDGTVFVSGADHDGVRRAVGEIEGLTKEIKIGDIYEGPVVRLMAFGAFVEILPGKDGLVHISEMAEGRVERVEDVVHVGDRVKVKVVEIDNLGRLNLSMKAAGEADGEAVGLSERELEGDADAAPNRSGGDRGPRPGGGGGDRGGDRGGRGGDRGPRGGGGGGGGGGGRSADRGPRFGSGGGYGG